MLTKSLYLQPSPEAVRRRWMIALLVLGVVGLALGIGVRWALVRTGEAIGQPMITLASAIQSVELPVGSMVSVDGKRVATLDSATVLADPAAGDVGGFYASARWSDAATALAVEMDTTIVGLVALPVAIDQPLDVRLGRATPPRPPLVGILSLDRKSRPILVYGTGGTGGRIVTRSTAPAASPTPAPPPPR